MYISYLVYTIQCTVEPSHTNCMASVVYLVYIVLVYVVYIVYTIQCLTQIAWLP